MVSANLRKLRRRKLLVKEAAQLIGEADEDAELLKQNQDKLYRELVGTAGRKRMLTCDDAVFFYPGIEAGIPISGPINPKEMCNTFFRENLPEIFPEAKATMAQMSVKEMCNLAVAKGMVVVFGQSGQANQIMAENPTRAFDSGTDMGTLKKVFDDFADSLVWLTGYDSVSQELVNTRDALGTHLLAWRRA